MRKIIAITLLLAMPCMVFAQSGTNSPYSQYGFGELSDQSGSANRGMNGLSYGIREHNEINIKNPASYSAFDSLTFMFDAGVGLQITNFEENGRKTNANNADLEYVTAGLRLARHLGVSFGLLPYTNVGYSYSNTANINAFESTTSPNATYRNAYSGSGGLHQVYLGAGWEPFKGISAGFNLGYLWGDIDRSIVNSYSDAYVNTLSKKYNLSVRNYTLDFGLQYEQPLSKTDKLTLGLTYAFGHKLNADAECDIISTNSQSAVSDTAKFKLNNVLKLPHMFGAGLVYTHNNQLKLGFDYQLQKWADLEYPRYTTSEGGASRYAMASGQFKDRSKFTLGGEYCKGERYRGFFNRLHYRAGLSYATPYLKINGQDGPREISASIGLGIPIVNGYNNRSILNISAQWVNISADNMIKENTFRINVGFIFNERWFAKFKVE